MRKIKIINLEIEQTQRKIDGLTERFNKMQESFDEAENENAISYEKHSRSKDNVERTKWSTKFRENWLKMRKCRRVKNKSKNKKLQEEFKLNKLKQLKTLN